MYFIVYAWYAILWNGLQTFQKNLFQTNEGVPTSAVYRALNECIYWRACLYNIYIYICITSVGISIVEERSLQNPL